MTDDELKAVIRTVTTTLGTMETVKAIAQVSDEDVPRLMALSESAQVVWLEKPSAPAPITPATSLCHECQRELGAVCTVSGGNRFCSATCVQLDMSRTMLTNLNEENKKLRAQLGDRSFIKPWEMGSGWSYRVTFDSVYDEADSLIAQVIDADRRGEPTEAALNIVIEEIDPIGGDK